MGVAFPESPPLSSHDKNFFSTHDATANVWVRICDRTDQVEETEREREREERMRESIAIYDPRSTIYAGDAHREE